MALACTTASCPHCRREFESTGGLFGQNAAKLRDEHVSICEENPRNRCFCGAVFPNGAARDKHAALCEMNPANRFKCRHCPQEFLTTFGLMGRQATDGKALRGDHQVVCKDNPANKCFCGNLFPNPEARNAHAVTCDKNPANQYKCQFCSAQFIKTFNMFGFCSNDGLSERDAHQVGCEKNPKNICFCGGVFSNPTARDRHASTCASNPVNRFKCGHCDRLFVTRFGVMGRVAYDGKSQRDSHEVGCEKNPGNVCYCGQLFMNPSQRDAHASKCEMNPANRFSCLHCRKVFISTFGIFSSHGGAERDAHMAVCSMNPANATCEHCGVTFLFTKGPFRHVQAEPYIRCQRHVVGCPKNPKNRYKCNRCGKCLVGGSGYIQTQDAEALRVAHEKVCSYIPCSYELQAEDDFSDWFLMSQQAPVMEDGTMAESWKSTQAKSSDTHDDPMWASQSSSTPSDFSGRRGLETSRTESSIVEGGNEGDVRSVCSSADSFEEPDDNNMQEAKRQDPDDMLLYSFEELQVKYADTYDLEELKSYWLDTCRPQAAAEPEDIHCRLCESPDSYPEHVPAVEPEATPGTMNSSGTSATDEARDVVDSASACFHDAESSQDDASSNGEQNDAGSLCNDSSSNGEQKYVKQDVEDQDAEESEDEDIEIIDVDTEQGQKKPVRLAPESP